MAVPFKFYLTHIANRSGYRANWEPNRPLELGMIGTLRDGVFDVQSSLEQQGITSKVLKDLTPGELDYTSHESVNIGTKLSGQAPILGSVLTETEAGFVIDFKSENSVVFTITDTLTHQIVNAAEWEKQVLAKFKDGSWKKEWYIITQLVEAVSATIIVNNSNDNRLELKASTGIGQSGIKLADVSLGLTVAKEKGSSLKVIAQKGITPLYRAMGIRHPLFGKPELSSKGDTAEIKEEKFRIQEFDPGELKE